MNSYFSYLFFIFASFHLNLMDLNSTDMESYQSQSISIRGFWYPLNENQGILSSSPHLKSCCVGAAHSIHQQILVENISEHVSTQQPVTLEGIFKINPKYHPDGQLSQLYVLEQAHLVQPSSYFIFIISSFILMLLVRFFIKK